MDIETVVIGVLIMGCLGWLWESFIFNGNIHNHDRVLNGVPFLPVYAIGFIILYAITKLKTNYIVKVIVSTIVLVSFECIAGYITTKYYGYRLWKYNGYSLCNGQVSISSILAIFGLSAIFHIIFRVED